MHRHVDEIVPLYVVFRTPFLEQSTLQAYLSRLAINLEAFVFSTAPPPEPQTRAPPPKEVLYSETIKGTTKPLVIQNGDEANPHTYVLWKLDVFICKAERTPNTKTTNEERPPKRKVSQTSYILSTDGVSEACREN
jgi:hypothetical protein